MREELTREEIICTSGPFPHLSNDQVVEMVLKDKKNVEARSTWMLILFISTIVLGVVHLFVDFNTSSALWEDFTFALFALCFLLLAAFPIKEYMTDLIAYPNRHMLRHEVTRRGLKLGE